MAYEIIEDVEHYNRLRNERIILLDHDGIYTGPELKEEWDYEPDPGDDYGAPNFVGMGELVSVLPSEFTEFAVFMPDKKSQTYKNYSFAERQYLRQIYDTPSKRTLLKCGRQVEKSTLLGNKLLSYSCIVTALNSLYVSPTNQQSKVFSQDRLKEPIETSQFLKSWTTTKLSDNVFLKKFINRSQITLRYAFMNADRCRGIPADIVCLDEIQDILTDNIPVIEQCASHSEINIGGEINKGGVFIYSGTPKSLDNTIESYWNKFSTQNEWVVPCHKHSIFTTDGKMTRVHWNILGEDHIGLEHLICDKCGGQIVPHDTMAQWAALNPDIINQIPKPYEGFRIPQLMVPWVAHKDIIQNLKTYPRDRFYNEVLGLSYDSGTRPLTQQDIKDNCSQYLQMDEASLESYRQHFGGAIPVYAGIDWSGGGEHSFTVLTLGAYLDSKFQVFYYRRFEGREIEPHAQMEEIIRLIIKWNVRRIGVDYGGGFWPNDKLTNQFGMMRVVKYQYSTPSEKVRWEDGLKRYLVNRTEVMSDVFNAIKRRDVFRFPNWEWFRDTFAPDFLNIFSEYNEQRRQIEYKKSPDSRDDAFHSALLCFLVSMLDVPRPDVIAPSMGPRKTS
jgi:hypothetical protein